MAKEAVQGTFMGNAKFRKSALVGAYMLLAGYLSGATVLGQGQVLFANRVPSNFEQTPVIDAPVIVMRGPFAGYPTTLGPGAGWTVQLMLKEQNGALSPLSPVSTFF